jgi:hypothetical protein
LKPQPLEEGAARDQHVVPAGGALDPDEVARPEILDASGVEWDHLANKVTASTALRRITLEAAKI